MSDCGCLVRRRTRVRPMMPNYEESYIDYCALHAAAGQMREALEISLRYHNPPAAGLRIFGIPMLAARTCKCGACIAARAALAAAEGREP